MITSESPATQSRSFFFGVNARLAGGFATAGFVGFGVGVVPGLRRHGRRRHDDRDVDLVVVVAADRVLHEPARPVEQERVADVARPPVSASATSRFVPGWPLNADLCIPGASSSAPKTSASSATISPWPRSRAGGRPRVRRALVRRRRVRAGAGGAPPLLGCAARVAAPPAAPPPGRAARARAPAVGVGGPHRARLASSPRDGGSTSSADSRIGGSFGSSGGIDGRHQKRK